MKGPSLPDLFGKISLDLFTSSVASVLLHGQYTILKSPPNGSASISLSPRTSKNTTSSLCERDLISSFGAKPNCLALSSYVLIFKMNRLFICFVFYVRNKDSQPFNCPFSFWKKKKRRFSVNFTAYRSIYSAVPPKD